MKIIFQNYTETDRDFKKPLDLFDFFEEVEIDSWWDACPRLNEEFIYGAVVNMREDEFKRTFIFAHSNEEIQKLIKKWN